MSSALSRLEAAAGDVIQILKGINEFQAARIAVIGGLALLKYNPLGRTTEVGSLGYMARPLLRADVFQDVDFIININSAPQGVKQKLLALPNSPFLEQAQFFFYRAKDGSYVQIDITAEWQVRTPSVLTNRTLSSLYISKGTIDLMLNITYSHRTCLLLLLS